MRDEQETARRSLDLIASYIENGSKSGLKRSFRFLTGDLNIYILMFIRGWGWKSDRHLTRPNQSERES